jgi:hypothetical protein
MGGDITPGLGYPLRIRVSSLDFLVSKPQELELISHSGCAKVADLLTIWMCVGVHFMMNSLWQERDREVRARVWQR